MSKNNLKYLLIALVVYSLPYAAAAQTARNTKPESADTVRRDSLNPFEDTFILKEGWRPNQDEIRRKQRIDEEQRQKDQETEKKKVPYDSTLLTYGIRIGVDVIPIILNFADTTHLSGWQINADMRITPKIYASVDFGYSSRRKDLGGEMIDLNGYYGKAGILLGINRQFVARNDLIYLGTKIGFSSYRQTLSHIQTGNAVWGPASTELNMTGLYTAWFELSAGLKVEVFRNFFMYFQGSYNVILSSSKPEGIPPLMVPGINQIFNGSTSISCTYGLAYMIPYKKKMFFQKPSKRELKKRALEEAGKESLIITPKGAALSVEKGTFPEKEGDAPESGQPIRSASGKMSKNADNPAKN